MNILDDIATLAVAIVGLAAMEVILKRHAAFDPELKSEVVRHRRVMEALDLIKKDDH